MVNRNSSRMGHRQRVAPRRRVIRLEVGIPSAAVRNSQHAITEDGLYVISVAARSMRSRTESRDAVTMTLRYDKVEEIMMTGQQLSLIHI